MVEKKYVLHAEYVLSKNDGEEHLVLAIKLVRLYNLNLHECILLPFNSCERERLSGYTKEQLDKLIHLYPRSDGNYSIKTLEKT